MVEYQDQFSPEGGDVTYILVVPLSQSGSYIQGWDNGFCQKRKFARVGSEPAENRALLSSDEPFNDEHGYRKGRIIKLGIGSI